MLEIKELCVLLLVGAVLLPAVAVAASPREGNGPVTLAE